MTAGSNGASWLKMMIFFLQKVANLRFYFHTVIFSSLQKVHYFDTIGKCLNFKFKNDIFLFSFCCVNFTFYNCNRSLIFFWQKTMYFSQCLR